MPVLKWGSEQTVGITDNTPGAKDGDLVGLADGGYIVVWEDDSTPQRVHSQRFDGAGQKIGGDTLLTNSAGFQPQVTAQHDGGFVIGFTAGSEADLEFCDSAGQPFIILEGRQPAFGETDIGLTTYRPDSSTEITLAVYQD